MKIRLSILRDVAMSRPGMWSDFMAVGRIAGTFLEISRADFDALQVKWFPGLALGTAIHDALKPIVRAVDRMAGTNLANCGGCAERQMRLNAMK